MVLEVTFKCAWKDANQDLGDRPVRKQGLIYEKARGRWVRHSTAQNGENSAFTKASGMYVPGGKQPMRELVRFVIYCPVVDNNDEYAVIPRRPFAFAFASASFPHFIYCRFSRSCSRLTPVVVDTSLF